MIWREREEKKMEEYMNESGSWTKYFSYLSPRLRSAVQSMQQSDIDRLQEIRIRAGRPLAVTVNGREHFLMMSGNLTAYPDQAVKVTRMETEETFRKVCEYSVYSYAKEIREGFITLRGGARVGISGTAVYDGIRLSGMRDVSSLCFRMPRQVRNCAARLARETVVRNKGGLLIAGKAGSGKTTMLRDLCRILGSSSRVSLIDTRGEIAGILHGVPQYDIGSHTDIFDGFPRSDGAVMALRAMTPEYIVCDEISTNEEAQALLQVYGCGVNIIASAHAGSFDDLMKRRALKPLIDAGVFSSAAILGDELQPGKLISVQRINAVC